MKPSAIFRPDLLQGQVIIVTGGGSGIGRAIAAECGALGATIAIGARGQARLDEAAEALRAGGAEVHAAPLDIRDEAACAAFVDDVVARYGRVDVLVNNAGGQFPSPAIQIRPKGWRAVVVNLTRTLALEWARSGVLVNAVAPGVIRSSGLETYPEAIRSQIETEVPKHIPLRRLGDVDDVAWAVAYLASPAGDYITGETLCVDGGQAHWGVVFPI